MLDLAKHIVKTKAGHFDPDELDGLLRHLGSFVSRVQRMASPPEVHRDSTRSGRPGVGC